MAYGPRQLAESFRTVRKHTITIAEEIPAERYDFRAAPEVKSAGEMLAHIAISPNSQIALHRERLATVDFSKYATTVAKRKADEQALRSKDDIMAALRDGGERFAAFLGALSPQMLEEVVSFPPPVQPSQRTRFEMLLSVKEHEMHHRAQLMLIQRMIGIVPHLTRQREAFAAQVRA
jgi:uncharacterized damage-inducible protein DinB